MYRSVYSLDLRSVYSSAYPSVSLLGTFFRCIVELLLDRSAKANAGRQMELIAEVELEIRLDRDITHVELIVVAVAGVS